MLDKNGIAKRIAKEVKNGYYVNLGIGIPMLEMSGNKHYKFMEDINYVYNEENPINDHKVDLTLVNDIAVKIRNKEPYKKLI